MPQKTKQAISLLAPALRDSALELPEAQCAAAEEIRLRVGQPLRIILSHSDAVIDPSRLLTPRNLSDTLTQAAQGSAHTALDQIRGGFFAAQGGHRVGICGHAAVKDGEIAAFREYTSLNIRIARALPGIAEEMAKALWCSGTLPNTAILSPPGYGKTTFLRDFIRILSRTRTVSVADERMELYGGDFDLGANTDIISGVPKDKAALCLLRSMSPDIIAMDEISAPEDVTAALTVIGCGVSLICTSHAADKDDFFCRDINKPLLPHISRVITIKKINGKRYYQMEKTQ